MSKRFKKRLRALIEEHPDLFPPAVLELEFTEEDEALYEGMDPFELSEMLTDSLHREDDLSKYGPINTYEWRVPFKHLDREGAMYWLRAYFTGDGYAHVGERPSDDDVRAVSVNRRGLEEVRSLLAYYFEIRSHISYWSGKKTKTTERWSDAYALAIRRRDLEKFRNEIGFDSLEKQRKLDYMVKRLRWK